MKYHEFQPTKKLRSYIRMYGYLKTDVNEKDSNKIMDLFPPTIGKKIIVILPESSEVFADNGIFRGVIPRSYVTPHESRAFQFWNNKPFEMFSVIFNPGTFRQFYKFPLFDLQDQLISTGDINNRGLSNFCQIIKDSFSNEERVKEADKYFISLLKRNEMTPSRNQEAIKKIMNAPHIKIQNLISDLNIGERQFRRTFKREIGTNPKVFQRNIRVAKASYLLKYAPQIDIWQISINCGYFDPSHFIQDFKKVMHVTPAEFRRNHFRTSKILMHQDEKFLEY